MNEEYVVEFGSHGDDHRLAIDLECLANALKPYLAKPQPSTETCFCVDQEGHIEDKCYCHCHRHGGKPWPRCKPSQPERCGWCKSDPCKCRRCICGLVNHYHHPGDPCFKPDAAVEAKIEDIISELPLLEFNRDYLRLWLERNLRELVKLVRSGK